MTSEYEKRMNEIDTCAALLQEYGSSAYWQSRLLNAYDRLMETKEAEQIDFARIAELDALNQDRMMEIDNARYAGAW